MLGIYVEFEEYFTFVETKIFEEDRRALMSDDEYQKLQAYLLENHELGDFIPNTNGCQKIRWKLESNNKGKSGGVRIIYYVLSKQGQLVLMMMYAKNRKDDMSEREKAMLKAVVSMIDKE